MKGVAAIAGIAGLSALRFGISDTFWGALLALGGSLTAVALFHGIEWIGRKLRRSPEPPHPLPHS